MTKYLIWPLLAFGLISCVSSPLEDRTTLNVTGQPELRAETIVGQNNAWSGFILKETAENALARQLAEDQCRDGHAPKRDPQQ